MKDEAKTKDEDRARDQAQCQLESIKEMVAALNCDYDRLQELKDERESLEQDLKDAEGEEIAVAQSNLKEWDDDNGKELAQLIKDAGECESREDAEQRIQEDPLEISVRSDWHSPGERGEDNDFLILLCTGGPAVRIRGELGSHNEPRRCWLEFQDWYTTWQELVTMHEDHDALLTYAQCFYFGE